MEMKLYRITFDQISYDQYDSFIVLAENEEQVVDLVKKEHPEIVVSKNYLGEPYSFKDTSIDWEKYKIEEERIDENARVLLGSFNAG
jgi:hypothetical protein